MAARTTQKAETLEGGRPKFTVLVEEHEWVRKSWEEHYRANNWPLETFENPLEFLKQLDRFSGRDEKIYFFFDEDFGRIRGVGCQLARAVKGLNAHQTVSLVTNHIPEFYQRELREGLLQYVFDKFPVAVFGVGFEKTFLTGRRDILRLMERSFEDRCALEKALNFSGYRMEFTLEAHFPSRAPQSAADELVTPVPAPTPNLKTCPTPSLYRRFLSALAKLLTPIPNSKPSGAVVEARPYLDHTRYGWFH
jgi:hypothetical protein